MEIIKDAKDVRTFNTYVVTLRMSKQFQPADTFTHDESHIIKTFVRAVVPTGHRDAEVTYHNALGQVMDKLVGGKSITLRIEGTKLKRANETMSRYIRLRKRTHAPLELRLSLLVMEEEPESINPADGY